MSAHTRTFLVVLFFVLVFQDAHAEPLPPHSSPIGESTRVESFRPGDGISSNVSNLPWKKFGFTVKEVAEKDVESLREKRTDADQKKVIDAEIAEWTVALSKEPENFIEACSLGEMGELIQSIVDGKKSPLIGLAFLKTNSRFPAVERCLREKLRVDLDAMVDKAIKGVSICLDPGAMTKVLEDAEKKIATDVRSKFERYMLVKDFGMAGMIVPLPSDNALSKHFTDSTVNGKEAFKNGITNPLEQAGKAYVGEKMAKVKKACGLKLTEVDVKTVQQDLDAAADRLRNEFNEFMEKMNKVGELPDPNSSQQEQPGVIIPQKRFPKFPRKGNGGTGAFDRPPEPVPGTHGGHGTGLKPF